MSPSVSKKIEHVQMELSTKMTALETVLKVQQDEISVRVDKLMSKFNENKEQIQIQLDKINSKLGDKDGLRIQHLVSSSSDDEDSKMDLHRIIRNANKTQDSHSRQFDNLKYMNT